MQKRSIALVHFPLASGLLTGKYRRGEAPSAGTRLSMLPAEIDSLLEGAG